MNGGREHYGWGADRSINADIFDAINQNTRATGNWKRPPKIPPYPRPESKGPEKKKPVSIEGLWARLSR